MLAAYGRNRHDHIVRTGQLAFNDIAHLLDPAAGPAPARLRTLMDFRLDARFRHWLLDEFQMLRIEGLPLFFERRAAELYGPGPI